MTEVNNIGRSIGIRSSKKMLDERLYFLCVSLSGGYGRSIFKASANLVANLRLLTKTRSNNWVWKKRDKGRGNHGQRHVGFLCWISCSRRPRCVSLNLTVYMLSPLDV